MAERAHPDDPAFCDGSVWQEELITRYEKANALAAGKDVLDCPCGCGWGTSLLFSASSVVGIDISSEAIAYAKNHYMSEKISFIQADMGSFDLKQSYDLIICLEGIEHVEFEVGRKAIQLFSKHLKRNGKLFISVPIKEPCSPPNPYHLYHYSQSEFVDLINSRFTVENMEIVQVTPEVDVMYCLSEKM